MELLTTKEASIILGVSRRRVIALIEQGKLKARKFSNVYIIAPNDLEAVKVRQNGRPENTMAPTSTNQTERPFRSVYDLAKHLIGSIEDDLPPDLSTNKKYMEDFGLSREEVALKKLKRKPRNG